MASVGATGDRSSIRQAQPAEAAVVAGLIRDSFRTVAEQRGLTPENCPTHPSNCTRQWVSEAMAAGELFYVLQEDGQPVGCVALDKKDELTGYLKRLAVLPDRRRRGYGRALVEHVRRQARQLGLRRLELATIADDGALCRWYQALGFSPAETRSFPQLPFPVLFMRTDL